MTPDEKKEALREAGVKVRSNASDETVEELYAENFPEVDESTETESAEVVVSDEAPPEAVTVEEETEPIAPITPIATNSRTRFNRDDFDRICAELATKHEGSKTPEVFAWADENLSAADFNELYAGKTVNGRKVQAK